MKWKENFNMEYGIVKVWNAMKDFINGMEWKESSYFHTFFIFAYFIVVFILSAVNKATFDQMHKMIKEKSSSQRSIK